MMFMSGSVRSDAEKRMGGSVAALIGLLLAFLTLPLCSAALVCTMLCCEHSGQPMEDHGTLPAPACGTECSVGSFTPAQILTPQFDAPQALPGDGPGDSSEIALSSRSAYRLLPRPRSNVRPLYVVIDVFLI